ncbi:MAG: LTA synthase family protein [Oscillospiraceae bacterium]|nr:LTA synthase family protein [Oscillospiraceae bacterium]
MSFFLVELFAFLFLRSGQEMELWPLAFGGLWAALLTGLLRLLPRKGARVVYGLLYALILIYAAVQTGYYYMFGEMLWLTEFRYGSEGSDYFDVLLSYPVSWYLCLAGLLLLGAWNIWKFPRWESLWGQKLMAAAVAVMAAACAWAMPELVFEDDDEIQYAGSDYGRAQSAEAAYDNMFNTHRLYQVCGLHQTAVKDIYANLIYPLTPGYAQAQAEGQEEIYIYMEENGKFDQTSNEMTGILEGKNVVLVLMESMDDWLIGEHTPTINRLMAEGINFTSFYTPPYGGIRTFNTEFCINTGSFLSSAGGYAFDYVTNNFYQSLPFLLSQEEYGYDAKTFHYNDPSFYSRGVFSLAMGYSEYVYYGDFVTGTEKEVKNQLYDDKLLFDNNGLNAEFFQSEKYFNFIITRSAHLSYKYNEVLSYWGLKQYPEYRELTDHEELNCAYLKAKLVDDMFARLLEELEEQGQLENTVIIGVTDHYTYGFKDTQTLLEVSDVDNAIWLERTPCFIWSADLEPMEVDKTLNTSDLVPTLLNMLGVETECPYMGSDAFDPDYAGFVPFSDGSWISGDAAWNASTKQLLYRTEDAEPVTAEFKAEMTKTVQEFTRINNLILETDYYEQYQPSHLPE